MNMDSQEIEDAVEDIKYCTSQLANCEFELSYALEQKKDALSDYEKAVKKLSDTVGTKEAKKVIEDIKDFSG